MTEPIDSDPEESLEHLRPSLRPAILQSTAIALQDATAYLRAIETLDVAATSVAVRLAAEGNHEDQARVTEVATAALERARVHYEAMLRLAEVTSKVEGDGGSAKTKGKSKG